MGFMEQLKIISENKRKALGLLFEEIQKEIARQETFIQTQNSQLKEAESSLTNLLDYLVVLQVSQEMIPNLDERFQNDPNIANLDQENNPQANLISNAADDTNLSKIAGVINAEEVERLRKLVFRATKGKSFVFTKDYDQDQSVAEAQKRSVYIIMYWAGDSVRDRIHRICDSFQGQRFELPRLNDIHQHILRMQDSIQNARDVLMQTR